MTKQITPTSNPPNIHAKVIFLSCLPQLLPMPKKSILTQFISESTMSMLLSSNHRKNLLRSNWLIYLPIHFWWQLYLCTLWLWLKHHSPCCHSKLLQTRSPTSTSTNNHETDQMWIESQALYHGQWNLQSSRRLGWEWTHQVFRGKSMCPSAQWDKQPFSPQETMTP